MLDRPKSVYISIFCCGDEHLVKIKPNGTICLLNHILKQERILKALSKDEVPCMKFLTMWNDIMTQHKRYNILREINFQTLASTLNKLLPGIRTGRKHSKGNCLENSDSSLRHLKPFFRSCLDKREKRIELSVLVNKSKTYQPLMDRVRRSIIEAAAGCLQSSEFYLKLRSPPYKIYPYINKQIDLLFEENVNSMPAIWKSENGSLNLFLDSSFLWLSKHKLVIIDNAFVINILDKEKLIVGYVNLIRTSDKHWDIDSKQIGRIIFQGDGKCPKIV